MEKRTDYNKLYMRKRREILAKNGVCVVCGCRPVMGNYTRCERCIEQQKEYRKRIKEIIENARN